MRLIPLILHWPNQHGLPEPDGLFKRGAGSLAWNVKLLLDRQTGKSLQFKRLADNPNLPPFLRERDDLDQPDVYAEVIDMSNIAFPVDAEGDGLWARRGQVRSTDDDWYNCSMELLRQGYDWKDDILLCWINGNPDDFTGIGGPAWQGTELRWNENRDPNVGGVALNGRAQVDHWIESAGTGEEAYRMLLYPAHEAVHALGEHHSGYDPVRYPKGRPYDEGYSDTLMGYGYNFIAAGRPRMSTMQYRAGLLLPEQQLRLREHAAFKEISDFPNEMDAGIVNSITLRKDGLVTLFEELAAGTITGREAIARLNVGPTQIERG